ncbi:F-box/FBD/LRR-repeat protein At4g26340-like [Cynara cardunculus var. scolymus]|uniref:F-box/FBD/LRR-repeat protein At4g26340-like n=1 Tax=Cynara cardunculus var. scolymus TaxID=59895 RepID=UPI000D625C1C|nr:F-box/FBD/LRR-repeat protein At4g26340-like [Cynara cardunculus var. scolymus]
MRTDDGRVTGGEPMMVELFSSQGSATSPVAEILFSRIGSRDFNLEGGRRRSTRTDFISEMSDDVLLIIMSFLPIKDAVVTNSLSTRWRALWFHLMSLNFEDIASLANITKNRNLLGPERIKFIKQVNCVLRSYNHEIVQDFRIRYDLDGSFKPDIDGWLRFAVHMSVENLELDLTDCNQKLRDAHECYDFPIRLSHRSIGHLYKWPTSKFTIIEIPSLKKLFLKSVNMNKATLQQILANSPCLETLSLHGTGRLWYIHVGRRGLQLKHLEIVHCPAVRFIYLNDFNLVSFTYKGPAIELVLFNLPKLKVLDIGEGVTGLENKVFRQIGPCLSYLQVLSLDIHDPKESLKLATVPELPMIKKLKLTIGAQKDDCLLEFTSIAEACPLLEVFAIELHWLSPIRRRRKVTNVADHPHEHLKRFEFVGYYGRISDLELVMYVVYNAVALQKILLDPRGSTRSGTTTTEASVKAVEVARSFASRQLEKSMPLGRGVEYRLKLVGCYGRVSDLELILYVMDNVVALKKILIDPRGLTRRETTTIGASLKAIEVARSFAKWELEKSMPNGRGLELVIL